MKTLEARMLDEARRIENFGGLDVAVALLMDARAELAQLRTAADRLIAELENSKDLDAGAVKTQRDRIAALESDLAAAAEKQAKAEGERDQAFARVKAAEERTSVAEKARDHAIGRVKSEIAIADAILGRAKAAEKDRDEAIVAQGLAERREQVMADGWRHADDWREMFAAKCPDPASECVVTMLEGRTIEGWRARCLDEAEQRVKAETRAVNLGEQLSAAVDGHPTHVGGLDIHQLSADNRALRDAVREAKVWVHVLENRPSAAQAQSEARRFEASYDAAMAALAETSSNARTLTADNRTLRANIRDLQARLTSNDAPAPRVVTEEESAFRALMGKWIRNDADNAEKFGATGTAAKYRKAADLLDGGEGAVK